MLRKVGFIFIGTFLSPWGDLIRSYLLLLILSLYTVHTSRVRPFKIRSLNTL